MMKKQPQYNDGSLWIGEENPKLGYKFLLKAKKILCEASSQFNTKIIVAETLHFGKVLLLGTKNELTLQYSDLLEFYDEMLAHIPMCSHGSAKKVLIIGGGDGGVLKEVLKYPSVREVKLVEIDKKVVEVSKKFFNHQHVFENEKVEIIFEEGSKFLAESSETYDVIIGDYTDPYIDSPAYSLITKDFYKNLHDKLEEKGIASIQMGSPILQKDIFGRILKNASNIFKIHKVYLAPVPIYPGGLWSFLALSKEVDPTIPRCKTPKTDYYSEEIHKSAFLLPNFIKEMIHAIIR